MSQQEPELRGRTGRDLILQSLPCLKFDETLRTERASTSSSHKWEGIVITWNTFLEEVAVESAPGNAPDRHILTWVDLNDPHYSLGRERYVCGEEKGVEGRFNNNVMQVMATAAEDHGINATCGDFRSTQESEKQKSQGDDQKFPDIAGMTATGMGQTPRNSLRFVGEVKADWTDRLRMNYELVAGGLRGTSSSQILMPWLRQVAKYMKEWQLKYGFITTYLSTIFVKYAKVTRPGEEGQDVIMVSKPVRWNDTFKTHRNYERTGNPVETIEVSLRQAMWLLMKKGSEQTAWRYLGPENPGEFQLLYQSPAPTRDRSGRKKTKFENPPGSQAQGGQGPSTGVGGHEYSRSRPDANYPAFFPRNAMKDKLLSLEKLPLCLNTPKKRHKGSLYFYTIIKKRAILVDPASVRFHPDLRLLTLCDGGVDAFRLEVSQDFLRSFMDSGLDITTRMMDILSI